MRSMEEGAHRQRRKSSVWSVVASRGVGRWWRYLGQKKREEVEISYAEGITQWRSQSAASWRWVDGGTHLGGVKKWQKGRKLWPAIFIGEGERELRGGHLESASDACVEPDRRAIDTRQVPLFLGHWLVGPGRVLKSGICPKWHPAALFIARPINKLFSIFSNWTEIVNCQNHLSATLKFTKLCKLIEWEIRNSIPFGSKFKFDIEFELKFLEEKLPLNLGQIYWGFKLV
jgi:hypothetical protein